MEIIALQNCRKSKDGNRIVDLKGIDRRITTNAYLIPTAYQKLF